MAPSVETLQRVAPKIMFDTPMYRHQYQDHPDFAIRIEFDVTDDASTIWIGDEKVARFASDCRVYTPEGQLLGRIVFGGTDHPNQFGFLQKDQSASIPTVLQSVASGHWSWIYQVEVMIALGLWMAEHSSSEAEHELFESSPWFKLNQAFCFGIRDAFSQTPATV